MQLGPADSNYQDLIDDAKAALARRDFSVFQNSLNCLYGVGEHDTALDLLDRARSTPGYYAVGRSVPTFSTA